jgi:phage shock protein A
MFVRKRKGGNQLIESYRDEAGKPRQRVVCNLGKHATPEEALEAARAELAALLAEPRRLEERIKRTEDFIRVPYERALDEWHGGEVPTLASVLEMAQRDLNEMTGYADSFVGSHDNDLSEFIWDMRELENARTKAREAYKVVADKADALRERIATLEGVLAGVVSK